MDRTLLLVAALAACGTQAAALPVHVVLDWPTGRPASALERARIQAVRQTGPAADSVPVEAEAGPDGVVLELGGGVWQVQASAPGYWSQAAEVVAGRQAPSRVRLVLWPAASLHGEILTAGGEPLPRHLEVRLSATPVPAGTGARAPIPRPQPSPSRAELRCRIEEGAWNCLGPAGLFDVQLEAAGYAPQYAWGVSLRATENTDFGRTALLRTASVFGRAVRTDGSDPQGPCRATLRAEVARRALEPGPESTAEGEASLSVPLTQRGYFQVLGVPPGRHVLAVECPAASGIREVRVRADNETRVDPPLLLEELTLDIAITPKADPEGRPWQLTVDATAPRLRRIAEKATTLADGRWVRRGLTAGSYRVAVSSSGGTLWLQRFFKLDEGSGPLSLRLPFVAVAGRVLLSAQPVRAQLAFFNEAGGEPATLTSDNDGYFQGLLPVAPDVQETRWTVEAHATHPAINRRLEGVSVQPVASGASAWLELALPAFAVHGTVVSDEGEPQSGAEVTFEETRSGARTGTATDDAGGFELPDLPAGSYTAVAESVEGASERTAFEVAEGIESELKLVLKHSDRVPFYVVSSRGPVADAAVQVWIPPGVTWGFTHTDADGRFEIELPPGTSEVGLTLGAPGYALKLMRLPVAGEHTITSEHTITLDASGGTLALDLQPSGRALDSSATPYLVHGGAIEAAGSLGGWGTDEANVSGDRPAVVEAIEPGEYALCLVADPAELTALWRGALPSSRCRKGSVEYGGTLTLSPP
jgi:hypothetical protein